LLSVLRSDVHLAYWDYQLRGDRRVGPWQLTLLLFGSSDDLEYHEDGRLPDYRYALRFHRISVRAHRWLGRGQVTAQLALGMDHSSAPVVNNYQIQGDAYSAAPRLRYEAAGENVDAEVGLDGQTEWLRPTSTLHETGASDLAHKRRAWLLGAFASASIHGKSRWTFSPGLRFDSYTVSGVTKMDLGPRLAIRFRVDDKTWLSASGGRFSQPPSLTVQVPAAGNFGLASYGLQTSWQAALGLGKRFGSAIEAEVTGYVQRYVLTDLRDPTLVDADPFAGDFLIRRDARSYGLECMLRRPPSERLHGWLSYTLSQNQRALEGGIIGPSDWDQRHILNAVVGYRLGQLTVGARFHLNTGRPVLTRGGNVESFVRLPAFYQLDLRAERRILFDAFALDVYAELVNTTATREVYGLDQDPTTNAIDQRSLRIVLPSVGIRGQM
jgi:hypothetical protein